MSEQRWLDAVTQVLRSGAERLSGRPDRETAAAIVNAKSIELRDALHRRGLAVGAPFFGLSRKLPYRGSLTVGCFAVPSFRMFSENDDLVVCSIFWTGSYETASTALWCKLLGQPGAVLDVGSYTGLYSLIAAAADPTRVVHAFEPLPGSFDRLRTNLAANKFEAVAAYPYAVGEREGEAVFNVFNNGDFLTTGGSLISRGHGAVAKALPVRVVSIDEHWREANGGTVALVKMDVEGAELPALRGMAGLLDRDGPDLLLEVLAQADGRTLTQFLAQKGYRFFAIDEKSAELQPVESLVGSGRPDDLNRLVTRKSPDELRSRFGIRVAERTGVSAVEG